jgi:hypothetical protein
VAPRQANRTSGLEWATTGPRRGQARNVLRNSELTETDRCLDGATCIAPRKQPGKMQENGRRAAAAVLRLGRSEKKGAASRRPGRSDLGWACGGHAVSVEQVERLDAVERLTLEECGGERVERVAVGGQDVACALVE